MVGKVLQGWCGSGGNVRLSHLVMSFLLLFREHHVVNAAMLLRSHFCPSVCLSVCLCLSVFMSLAVVTMEGKYELVCSLLNVAIFSDLDWAHSLKYSLQHCSWKYCFLWKHKSSVVHLSCLLLEFVCFWSLHIHCESKKTGPFFFWAELWQILSDFNNSFTVADRN